MAFCEKCGRAVSDDANFCAGCGAPVKNASTRGNPQRRQVYDGVLKKCPNCGEVLNSFTAICPSCGYELREAKASTAISEFSRRLTAVDEESIVKPSWGFWGRKKNSNTDEILNRKVEIIKTFAVPNTKEDVFEFLILAASCIDTNIYAKLEEEKAQYHYDKRLADAWLTKVKQVYKKAHISFGNDEDFWRIQDMYNTCIKDVSRNKKIKYIKWIALASVIIGFILSPYILAITVWGPQSNAREADRLVAETARLDAIVQDVNNAIEAGDYNLALITANTLHFDGSDDESQRQWDIKRKHLMLTITEQAKEKGYNISYDPKAEAAEDARRALVIGEILKAAEDKNYALAQAKMKELNCTENEFDKILARNGITGFDAGFLKGLYPSDSD